MSRSGKRGFLVAALLLLVSAVAGLVLMRRTPSSLRAIDIADPSTHWTRSGFAKMTPSIRPPTRADGGTRIEVWLHLPPGQTIGSLTRAKEPTTTLVYPPGTIADRIEWVRLADGRWTIVDVRGSEITSDGIDDHVYRPVSAATNAPLRGFAWRRGDEGAHRHALDELLSFLAVAEQPGLPSSEREAFLQRFAGFHACTPCHAQNKASDRRPRPIPGTNAVFPPGPTDTATFFTPLLVLADTNPLRLHRERDDNADDRFVRVHCSSGAARLETQEHGARTWRCDDGELAYATLDLRAALAAKDGHARAVCASRDVLWQHMNDETRARFAAAKRVCEEVSP